MALVKPERYTELPKGYLTYPYTPNNSQSIGLASVLLKETTDKRYVVKIDSHTINEKTVNRKLADALKTVGCDVSKITIKCTEGRKTLTTSKIPVEIRKIVQNKQLAGLRIRVTGETEGQLLENINKIKNLLAQWGIKPSECVWSQSGWKNEVIDTQIPKIQQTELEKEQNRLKNIVADLQDKVNSLEKQPMLKAIREERKTRVDVMR